MLLLGNLNYIHKMKLKNIKIKIPFNENKLKYIYYSFHNNTDIFKCASFSFNNSIKNEKIFLRDFKR